MKSFLCVLLLLAAIGCKDEARSSSEVSMSPTEEVSTDDMSQKDMPRNAIYSEAGDDAGKEVRIEQKIIKESHLRFETNDLVDTYSRISSAVTKHKAVIQNDVEGKNYESLFRNVTVRIPSENFDAFLADVGKGVSYFDRKEISSRDVTEEFIDVEARLRTKKTLELRYLELLKKATKISEILEIEKQLTLIREEIEAKEGQLKYLQDRVSLSTVNIEFYKKTAIESGITVSYGSKMWNAVKSGFNGISAFFIGLLHIWPFIIILAILVFWLRKRFMSKKKTV